MKLKFLLFAFVFLLVPFVWAYNVDVILNSNVADFNTDVYSCSNSECSSITFYDSVNSGTKQNIYELVGQGNDYYAEYDYKSCFYPQVYIAHVWDPYSASNTFSLDLYKKANCKSLINEGELSKNEIEVGENVLIGINIQSAFPSPNGNPNPIAIPSNILEQYSSGTKVEFYANDVLIDSQEEEISIGSNKDFEYSWIPSQEGTYEIKVKTTVNDCVCSSQETQEYVIGTIVVNAPECTIDPDCETDFYSDNYCYDNDIYKDFHDFFCSIGACNEDIIDVLVQDCGDDYCESYGNNYCKNDDVYHSRTCYERGCLSSDCFSNNFSQESLVAECDYGCYNGQCIIPLADFGIDNGVTVPEIVYENSIFMVKFDKHNTGLDDLFVPVAVYIDGEKIDSISLINFPAGTSLGNLSNLGPLGKGEHEFKIIIDPQNIILEENEGNNEFIFDFDVFEAPVCETDDDCDEDYNQTICQDDDVYLNIIDYSCLDNQCIFNLTEILQEDCGQDEYGNWSYYCLQDELWKSRYYANHGCLNAQCFIGTVTQEEFIEDCEYGCSNTECNPVCEIDSDCSADYYSNKYCSRDDIYKDFYNFSCVNNQCQRNITKVLVDECDEDCKNGKCQDNDCSNGDCDDEDEDEDDPDEGINDEDCTDGICDALCLTGNCKDSQTINLGRYNYSDTISLGKTSSNNEGTKYNLAWILFLLLIGVVLLLIVLVIVLMFIKG